MDSRLFSSDRLQHLEEPVSVPRVSQPVQHLVVFRLQLQTVLVQPDVLQLRGLRPLQQRQQERAVPAHRLLWVTGSVQLLAALRTVLQRQPELQALLPESGLLQPHRVEPVRQQNRLVPARLLPQSALVPEDAEVPASPATIQRQLLLQTGQRLPAARFPVLL